MQILAQKNEVTKKQVKTIEKIEEDNSVEEVTLLVSTNVDIEILIFVDGIDEDLDDGLVVRIEVVFEIVFVEQQHYLLVEKRDYVGNHYN